MSELFWILKSISFHNAGSEVFSFKGIEFQAFGIRLTVQPKLSPYSWLRYMYCIVNKEKPFVRDLIPDSWSRAHTNVVFDLRFLFMSLFATYLQQEMCKLNVQYIICT